MGGKSKKGGKQGAPKPIVDESNVSKKGEPSKEEELNRIMTGMS